MFNTENYFYDDYSQLDEYNRNAIYPKAMPYVYGTTNPSMNNFDNSTFSNTFMMPSNSNVKVLDPYKGFMRGNMFENLYDPYRNFKPNEVKPLSERDAMLQEVQKYDFALNDLALYLDIYPNNGEILSLYNEYLKSYNNAVNNFERSYGPLCRDSVVAATNTWNYDNSPWPWEVQR